MLTRYRDVLAFRRGEQPLVKGSIELLDAPGDVLMFTRTHGNETLLCAFNFAERAGSPWPLPAGLEAWADRLSGRRGVVAQGA